jgi:hypothetical protein
MGYTPSIAECRLALVEEMQLSAATKQYDNAEGANNVLRGFGYTLAADLTTTLTGGAIRGKCLHYVSFIAPTAATFTANIGDKCTVLLVDSRISVSAPYDVEEWEYFRYGWMKVSAGGGSDLTSETYATAFDMQRIWGTCSATSGTFRGLSVRTQLTGTGTEDGESLRAYTLITGTITGSGVHGAHITAQIGSETVASTANCTGEVSGVRATIGIGLTNTAPVGGTISALRLDSYFLSTGNGASSSFIYACDVGGTYGVKSAFMQLGTMTNRQTSAATAANGPYSYVTAHITPSNCDGVLKVITPDGTFYIPLYTTLA